MNQQPLSSPGEAQRYVDLSTVPCVDTTGFAWRVRYSRNFPTTLHRWCDVRPYKVKETILSRDHSVKPSAATLAQWFAIAPRNRAEHLTPGPAFLEAPAELGDPLFSKSAKGRR